MLTEEFHFKLSKKEMLDLEKKSIASGLSKGEVCRLALKTQVLKSNPPKEFYDSLNKVNKLGVNINQLAKIANTNGEIYYDDLNVYYSSIDKLIKDIRNKYL